MFGDHDQRVMTVLLSIVNLITPNPAKCIGSSSFDEYTQTLSTKMYILYDHRIKRPPRI